MAARVVPWSAPVWPTAATTPRAASRAIDSSAPGSSGAMVTMRMVPRPRSTSAATSAGAGMTRRAGSWAPRYSGASHGPSRWMPAIVPRSTSRVRTSTCRSRAAVDPVTRLATTVVVPWARCVAAARATSAGSSVTKDAPPPPWQCTSTNPGARTGSERSGCAGGTPSPTSTIVPPSMRTQPLRKLVPSKSRSAAISVVGAMTATYRAATATARTPFGPDRAGSEHEVVRVHEAVRGARRPLLRPLERVGVEVLVLLHEHAPPG